MTSKPLRAFAKRVLRRVPGFFNPYLVSRSSIVWSYRLLLGRNPENAQVVREKLDGPLRHPEDLLMATMFSGEFAERHPWLSPFPPGSVVIKELPLGGRLFVDLADVLIGTLIARGQYETEMMAFLPRFLEPGATVLDIGANIGFYTIQMAELVGAGGHVVAFEPIVELAALLRRSIVENGFGDRVRLEAAAAGDVSGEAEIRYSPLARNSGASYLVTDTAEADQSSQERRRVPVRALDDCELPGRVAFIKIDIEGAEPLCFRGATRLLERDRPLILSEVHDPQLRRVSRSDGNAYLAQLAACGYRPWEPNGTRWQPFTRTIEPKEILLSMLFVPTGHRLERELERTAAPLVS